MGDSSPYSRLAAEWKARLVRSVKRRGLAGTAWLAVLLLVKHLIQIPARHLIDLTRYTISQPSKGPIPHQIPGLIQLWQRCTTRTAANPYFQFLDRRYDRRFAVDTAGIHVLPEILADPRFNGYSPSPMSRAAFFRILRRLHIDYSQFLFIDFGCGKGKPLLLASELPFKAIIGIEFLPVMVRAAEENLRTYRGPQRCKAVQVLCCNVLDYGLPGDPTVYYMFDPFVAVVMTEVIENIRRSLVAAPRQIFIIYVIPNQRRVLDQSGFLKLVREDPGYCIYKSP
jgi:SAM-dependent methyltransferase